MHAWVVDTRSSHMALILPLFCVLFSLPLFLFIFIFYNNNDYRPFTSITLTRPIFKGMHEESNVCTRKKNTSFYIYMKNSGMDEGIREEGERKKNFFYSCMLESFHCSSCFREQTRNTHSSQHILYVVSSTYRSHFTFSSLWLELGRPTRKRLASLLLLLYDTSGVLLLDFNFPLLEFA